MMNYKLNPMLPKWIVIVLKLMLCVFILFIFLIGVILAIHYVPQIKARWNFNVSYKDGITTVVDKEFGFSFRVHDKCVLETNWVNNLVSLQWNAKLFCGDRNPIYVRLADGCIGTYADYNQDCFGSTIAKFDGLNRIDFRDRQDDSKFIFIFNPDFDKGLRLVASGNNMSLLHDVFTSISETSKPVNREEFAGWFYEQNPECSIQIRDLKNQLADLDAEKLTVKPKEYDIQGIPSEGTNVKVFQLKNGYEVFEVRSFAAIARFFTDYYVHDGQVIYASSTTDEWDLKKLHGENGEKTAAEGEAVVATSTTESYSVQDGKLCQYYAKMPRQNSPATTASDPLKDLADLLSSFDQFKK